MSFLDTFNTLFGRTEKHVGSKPGKGSSDLRRTRRIPQRMRSGFVWTEKLITPRACIFRDLSLSGARVEILGDPIKASLLLDGVKLYFATEKHEIPCSVAWLKGQMLGLRFEGKPRMPSRKFQ